MKKSLFYRCILIAGLLVVTATGCSSTSTIGQKRLKNETTETIQSKIKNRISTRDEVIALYGAPQYMMHADEGELVFIYEYREYKSQSSVGLMNVLGMASTLAGLTGAVQNIGSVSSIQTVLNSIQTLGSYGKDKPSQENSERTNSTPLTQKKLVVLFQADGVVKKVNFE